MTTPHHLDDARWRRCNDRRLVGEPLSEAEEEFLATYMPRGPEYRAEDGLWRGLARLGEEPLADAITADDEVTINWAVERHLASPRPLEVSTPSRRRHWLTAAVAVGSVAAAVLLGIAIGKDWEQDASSSGQAPSVAQAERAAGIQPSTSAAVEPASPEPEIIILPDDEDDGPVRLEEGTLVASDGRRWSSGVDPTAQSWTAPEGRACLSRGDSTLCLDSGARVRLDAEGQAEIEEGRGRVEAASLETATSWVVVGGHRVQAAPDTVFSVEVEVSGRFELTVERGEVRIHDAAGVTRLAAGATLERESSAPEARRSSRPDATELLRQARALRARGDASGAARAYERLISAYPAAAAAKTALVSVGQLYLESGRPKPALRAFDRYLAKGGGPLTEEALYGRIRALGSLKRTRAQHAAIESFLERYPSSSYAPSLRRRHRP